LKLAEIHFNFIQFLTWGMNGKVAIDLAMAKVTENSWVEVERVLFPPVVGLQQK